MQGNHNPLFKKPLFWIIVTCLIVLISLFVLFRPGSTSSPKTLAADRIRLKEIFKKLDMEFWEDPTQGSLLADTAIALAGKTGDSTYLAKGLLKKASCLQMLDRADSSLWNYQLALKVSERIHNDSLVAKCKNGIANFYLRKEDYQQAMNYLTEALKVAEKVNYKHSIGLIYNGLGLVSISLKKYDKAIDYFEKAKIICKELGDVSNEAGINLNIANCYAETRNFNRAKGYYEDNLKNLQIINDSGQIVLAYINLAIVNRNLGNTHESFLYLDKASQLLKTFKNQSLLCTTLLEVGTTWLETGNLPLAKKFLAQSLAISTGTISRTNSMEALSRLSDIAGKEGNFRLAYDYFKHYDLLKDSVMNDETRKSIAEIQLKYDIQKKEYENELLGKKYEIQRRKSVTLGIIFGSFFIVVLLIGILIWLSHKNLKKSFKLQELTNQNLQEKIKSEKTINQLEKLKYQAEIEAKNKELTTTSLQLVTKNKILSDISKMTDEFHENKSMDKVSYKGLQRIIKENLNTDKEWEQFKELFENVHQDFFTGLKNHYPELSENELRLCAYLKINLQNKEIAKILNVSPATVTTSRYRVRKKLKMEPGTVLEDFLRNF